MKPKHQKRTSARRPARSRKLQVVVSPDLVWRYITKTETCADEYMHSIKTKDGVTITHLPSGVQAGPFNSTAGAKRAIATWVRKAQRQRKGK